MRGRIGHAQVDTLQAALDGSLRNWLEKTSNARPKSVRDIGARESLRGMTWRHLPDPARAIAVAASDAVAAREHNRDRFGVAVETLAGTEGSGLVLGAVVRLLLEELHPDGLDSDDIRQVIENCLRAAAAWQPSVDPHTVLVLLTGALGIHDQDEQAPPPTPASLARHTALLVADLLTATPRPLAWYLTATFAEIERTELHD